MKTLLKKTLTEDELDLFTDSLETDLFPIYLKIIKELQQNIAQDMLRYNLLDLSEKSLGELALLKAQGQGCDKLVTKFAALGTIYKNKQ